MDELAKDAAQQIRNEAELLWDKMTQDERDAIAHWSRPYQLGRVLIEAAANKGGTVSLVGQSQIGDIRRVLRIDRKRMS
jgi:hypothetical protein